ncbi:MAG: hypothetical protein K0S43_3523, partial [Cellulosimicrobium sp.]|nr:hypothetical protein [Cellulosimicrobium sp.]
ALHAAEEGTEPAGRPDAPRGAPDTATGTGTDTDEAGVDPAGSTALVGRAGS